MIAGLPSTPPKVAMRILFVLLAALAASPWISPPFALLAGIVFGTVSVPPPFVKTHKVTKRLLQACVVGLGFGISLDQVWRAGSAGFVYTALVLVLALAAGLGLGRLIGVGGNSSLLITSGTAICGGSAIAAVGAVANASDEEMSVSLGTVFILNSVALLVFPFCGTVLGLTQSEFGLWSALAIHDTSSVAGAGAKYGPLALSVGVTVKLARTLWIIPLTLGTAYFKHRKGKITWPWFIAFFVAATAAPMFLPVGAPVYSVLVAVAKAGLKVTLFLIGSEISIQTVKKVGVRPLAQGVMLWIFVSVVSLLLIKYRLITL